MGRKLTILDESTGEYLEDIEFSGGYIIQYASYEDSGRIKHITHLNNAKWGERHWIKNEYYAPIARKLVSKFKEINFIKVDKILFLEDEIWSPKGASKTWMARAIKANAQFAEFSGYDFIIETRKYFTEKMSEEQFILLLYHELRHIDQYGGLIDHDVEDWDNIVATFGAKWAETKTNIQNILSEGFEDWEHLRSVRGTQTSLFDNVVPLSSAK